MTDGTLKEFEAFLAGRGLRLTGQRRLIAQTFFRKAGHHSAEEIYRQVKRKHPGIGSATVYRTMKLLRDAGLATGMNIGDGFARYEPSSRRGHHDHLICQGCGKIVEFENDQIETLQMQVALRHGFTVSSHKMELYGMCGGCRRKAGKPRRK
jgi:Fur family ferric uptake transcriptional regulator